MAPDPRPWKRVRKGERKDYQILRVGEDVFADPRTGEEHDRVIIEADDWCNVLPLTTDGRVVLIKQFRFGSQEISLELPGGVVDEGETPDEAVKRELEEETGYRAGRVVKLGVYRSNPAHFTNRVHSFVALECESVNDGHPDGSEDVAVELVRPRDLVRLVGEERVTHALMIASIGLAAVHGYLAVGEMRARNVRRAARG
ncbi:MAG: NUDIX hydrolase [Chloroflexota bacterium]|nr:NUDIX hydrolase [Chloroflexota bacterium]